MFGRAGLPGGVSALLVGRSFSIFWILALEIPGRPGDVELGWSLVHPILCDQDRMDVAAGIGVLSGLTIVDNVNCSTDVEQGHERFLHRSKLASGAVRTLRIALVLQH